MGRKKSKETKVSPDLLYVFEDINMIYFTLFQAILVGDFILSAASMALARIGNITVVKVLSQVIEDLVRGTVIRFFG